MMQGDVDRHCSVRTVEKKEKKRGEQSHPQPGLHLPESKSWSTGKPSCELLLSVSSKEGAT